MRRINRSEKIWPTLIVTLLIALSGTAYTSFIGRNAMIYCAFALALISFLVGRRLPPLRDMMLVFAISAISLIHLASFGSAALDSAVGFVIIVATAVIIANQINNFWRIYLHVMYFLSIMSLFWWYLYLSILSSNAIPTAFVLVADPVSIATPFHTFMLGDNYWRNSGIFFEPGAFAGYLLLALFFALFGRGVEPKLQGRTKPIVLVLAILSTASSAGYVGLLFLLIGFFYLGRGGTSVSKKQKIGAILMLLILPLVSYFAYHSVEILGSKIEQQLEQALSQEGVWQLTRFGNFIYDLKFIELRPLFGWSGAWITRLSTDPSLFGFIDGQGNGLSGFAVRFGLVGLAIVLALIFETHWRISRRIGQSAVLLITIATILMGQQYLNFPLIYVLCARGRDRYARARPLPERNGGTPVRAKMRNLRAKNV